jgi:hypothetical protein
MKSTNPGDRVLDVQQARTAGTRYKEYGLPERPPHGYTDEMALPPDKRKTYLKATLTKEKARATVAEAESHGARRSARETLASIGHERIIGSSDLRDINYLETRDRDGARHLPHSRRQWRRYRCPGWAQAAHDEQPRASAPWTTP